METQQEKSNMNDAVSMYHISCNHVEKYLEIQLHVSQPFFGRFKFTFLRGPISNQEPSYFSFAIKVNANAVKNNNNNNNKKLLKLNRKVWTRRTTDGNRLKNF